MAGERGLRASLPSVLPAILCLAVLLVACGGPDGSAAPSGAADADGADATSGARASSTRPGSPGELVDSDLAQLGDMDLEVATYPVDDALAAEGGDAIGAMLDSLSIDPDDVELTLAVGPGGEPTISDWRLPGASASAILEAWAASAPGTWSSTTLAGISALTGTGPDGSSAWAVAGDGRFVYIRSDDLMVAEEIAGLLGP